MYSKAKNKGHLPPPSLYSWEILKAYILPQIVDKNASKIFIFECILLNVILLTPKKEATRRAMSTLANLRLVPENEDEDVLLDRFDI